MSDVIHPGSALGVLGGGQLGRMFAIAARRMGYRVHVFAPEAAPPAGAVADRTMQAAYDDLDAVAEFARGVSVVTFEFENVSADAAATAARHAPVRPDGAVLQVTQHRLREKTFLKNAGLPVTPFAAVRSMAELHEAIGRLGTPAVLKTAAWGYDGKGQTILRSPDDADRAWQALNSDEAVLEAFIDFDREVSVVAVRSGTGEFACFGPIENRHRNHILDLSLCPAALSPAVHRDSIDIARAVVEKLDVVGVLCVEFFVTRDDTLLINELAPRPHNSGHLSIDAHASCQFEQQVRSICGLPLASTEQLRPAAMANLLGDVWPVPSDPAADSGASAQPDWAAALRDPAVKLHLYGKREARPGRKMGHLTALAAADADPDAAAIVQAARDALISSSSRQQ